MSPTTAKYFEQAKWLWVQAPTWTLTVRAPTRGSLCFILRKHGLKLAGCRWEKLGDIYYANVKGTK